MVTCIRFFGFVLRLFVIINNDEHSVVDVFGLVGELCPDPGFRGGVRLFILQSWLLADEGVLRLPGGRTDWNSKHLPGDGQRIINIGRNKPEGDAGRVQCLPRRAMERWRGRR